MRRGFWSLIVTQFEGAFNDNALKMVATFIALDLALPSKWHASLLPLTAGLFSLPFILFSMAGGYLADRHSKRTITIAVKMLEVGIMSFASLGFWSQSLWMGLTSIFLMGVHSAIFGPSKYGLLPELLPEQRLSWGNGIIELGTFLAIISGMAGGTLLFNAFKGREVWSGAVLVGLAIAGLGFSFGITRVPAADPLKQFRFNFLGDLWGQVQGMRRDRVLWLACLGNMYFWFVAQLLQQGVMDYGLNGLSLGDTLTSCLLAVMAIGIGLGSFAAGYLSGGKIEYGLVPLGAVGLSLFMGLLWKPNPSFGSLSGFVLGLGFFGGFFIVPLSAILQHRPAPECKGTILAAANLLSAVGLFLAAGVYELLTVLLRCDARQVFLVSALLTLGATAYILWLLPDSLLRLGLWFLSHSLYRIRVLGRQNIPTKGGALFVCNHLSFVDALLLVGSTDREIRFMMYKGIYDKPWVHPFARILRAIPISSELRPRAMLQSLRSASEAIQAGEVVCIFAEGQITRIGQLLPFRRGFERIMRGVNAPIVPIALDGIWGSIFSFEKGRFGWKLPRRIPYPVTVCYGAPMAAESRPSEVRQVVQELLAKAWECRRKRIPTLSRAFIRTARQHPLRFAMADGQVPHLTFGSALVKAVFLARRLHPAWAGQQKVGLLLPPSVAGALVNHAVLLAGKVPVNLNYTLSAQALASCIEQCGIRTVISSRVFLEKLKLTIPCETILLESLLGTAPAEDTAKTAEPRPRPLVRGRPKMREQITALAMAWLLPAGWLERALGNRAGRNNDLLATVLFSSGSTGDPKGVMLSHYNIASNIGQLEQVFGFEPRDRVLGILPFFHSFGFTGTLCLPAVLGVGVVYHSTPLDGRRIGALVCEYAVTFLLATPTFLQLYLRSCTPEQFGSLRLVMTGAEKLPERLALVFEEQYGIRPLEGYGCTECSPVVAVNTRDYRSAGFRQVGAKRGKIGHPLPGVCVRIVDPETGQLQPIGQAGLMLVRGPNIMQGYLNRPEQTAAVLHEGWYETGDIAAVDEDGFIQITDRLSRFSKIGGEMVPHIRIEDKLHELAGSAVQSFVVSAVPDERKGERLVVLHTLQDGPLEACLQKLAQSDLPNLWKPRPDQFFRVEAFPCLGTGKLDLKEVRALAVKLSTMGA